MLQILSMSVKEFGSYIRRVREEKGFPLSKVEHQSGGQITGSYVNQIENGMRSAEDISLGKLLGLAKGLQISIDELLVVALGKDFEQSATYKNKIDSALVASDSWNNDGQQFFYHCVQIVVSGMRNYPAFQTVGKFDEAGILPKLLNETAVENREPLDDEKAVTKPKRKTK